MGAHGKTHAARCSSSGLQIGVRRGRACCWASCDSNLERIALLCSSPSRCVAQMLQALRTAARTRLTWRRMARHNLHHRVNTYKWRCVTICFTAQERRQVHTSGVGTLCSLRTAAAADVSCDWCPPLLRCTVRFRGRICGDVRACVRAD